jgi:ATP-dependent DNA helicase RecG
MARIRLETDVRFVPGVGPSRAAVLAGLGVATAGGLLLHLPSRYLDRRSVTPVADLAPGGDATVVGTVGSWSERRLPGGRRLMRVHLSDGTGAIPLVFFNSPWMRSVLAPGARIAASGRVDARRGLSMPHPDITVLDEEGSGDEEAGGMTPVYPLSAGLTQKVARRLVLGALEAVGDLPDLLPRDVLRRHGFGSRSEVYRQVHAPADPGSAASARRLLALEELFVHQVVLADARAGSRTSGGIVMETPAGFREDFGSLLPYRLTGAQERAVSEIVRDMASGVPMRRLLQGDVGSGKTAAAAAACLLCARSGWPCVVLAPTEVLAAQHHRTLSALLERSGIGTLLLTGGSSTRERRRAAETAASGTPSVFVGTHALLEDSACPAGLGLLVIDEQHKFGVEQRERLLSGRRPRPHLLVMSATPIPRTLAMAVWGDLDLSVLDEMPPGRGRILTRVVGPGGRREAYSMLLERLGAGERAYVVYPLKESTEAADMMDATTASEILARGPAGRFGVALLHGAMPPAEKLARAAGFASGEFSVLVSTTVVEVGLDVPEATVLIVSDADRFGLGQLHQLRGRIGRGGGDAWCYLVAGRDAGSGALARLAALESSSDGFEIARLDLSLRGPGDLLGTRQHGLPDFRVADLASDWDLLPEARTLAEGSPNRPEALIEAGWRFGGAGVTA